MSPRLPTLRPRDVLRAPEKAGFVQDRQTGSHIIILYKAGHPVPVTLPWHCKDLKRGRLRQIIKDAGLDVETFLELL